MLFSDNVKKQYSSSWALVWLGACQIWTPPAEPDLLGRLFILSQHSPEAEVRRFASWALASQPLATRDDERRCTIIPRLEFESLLQSIDEFVDGDEKASALIVAWYLRALDDAILAQHIHAWLKDFDPHEHNLTGLTLRELLKHLGEKP